MASTARLDELKKKFDENPRRYFAPLANEHRKSGDLDQAIALCRAHLPQQPAHISGHIVLAQALYEAGSLDEAREIFHTALGLDPENLIALRYLGDLARDAADVETARGWYQRVLEVDPRNDEIVQLVRDLDAPRPVATDSSTVVPESIAAPTPSAPADNDARFAPLSIEQMDVDVHDDLAGAPSQQQDVAPASEATHPETSFDVHAAWTPGSPTVELPTVDAPELDPFAMDPSGSADSLFDAGTTPGADDFFLTELSSQHGDDTPAHAPEYSASETWTPAAESAPTSSTPTPEADASSFEEGSFYLEPPPAAPVEAASTTSSGVDEGWELPDASAVTPNVAASAASEASFDALPDVAPAAETFDAAAVAHASPDVIDEFTESPTAEWQAPAAPSTPAESAPIDAVHAANDLGLEVMEFVPPSSQPSVSPERSAATDTDPLIGHTPELLPADESPTPASFVTETMAELYLQQGFRNEALAVYRELLSRSPGDESLRERVQQIESGSMSSLGMATLSDNIVESALKRQSAKPARSVRSFFASLAGRRAPHPEPRNVDAAPTTDASSYAPTDEPIVESGPASAVVSSTTNIEPTVTEAAEPNRNAPMMSAAETLASFDPFADTTDAVHGVPGQPVAEAAPTIQSAPFQPNVEAVAAAPAPAASSDAPARRSLEDLFPDTPITARTEAAAQTLATAFGRTEPQGRPTRAASSELSLDKVFRGTPDAAPAGDGGFSFDQFFSDARPAGADVTAQAVSQPETGRSGGGAGDAHDIEQFTAWLEGLKKK